MTAEEFGVLFSHASEAVLPGLVDGPYRTDAAALARGGKVCRAQPGIEYVVMHRPGPDAPWVSGSLGIGAAETIRALWADPT